VLLTGVLALLMALLFERFGGLRISAEQEIAGQDSTLWGVTAEEESSPATAGGVPGGVGHRVGTAPDVTV
jgi:hypothetical protein